MDMKRQSKSWFACLVVVGVWLFVGGKSNSVVAQTTWPPLDSNCSDGQCVFAVSAGSDDAGASTACLSSTTRNEIYFGRCSNGNPIVSGFRFANVALPYGTGIARAYLVFTVDGLYTTPLTLTLHGENSANALTFTATNQPVNRSRIAGVSTAWLIPASDVWAWEDIRQSPDITAIIQAIVDKSGWQTGNALAILTDAATTLTLGAHRRVFAYERLDGTGTPGLQGARLVIQTGPRKTYVPTVLRNSPLPITSTSYYAINMNLGAWYSIGSALGISDTVSDQPRDRLVVLVFGRPKRSGTTYGVNLVFDQTYTFYSTTDVANVVKEFARGYWDGTQGNPKVSLRISVGTNNCCNGDPVSLFQGHGIAWAQMMNSLSPMVVTYTDRVTVTAGIDIEMDFNNPYTTTQWVSNFINTSVCIPGIAEAGCLYNYGTQSVAVPTISPGPCNYNSPTSAIWAACDVWYLAWGAKRTNDTYTFIRPLPEVYHAPNSTYPYGYDATQWAALSLYSANLTNAGPIHFVGSLTQYARCGPICYVTGGSYANNTPENGWIGLMDALGSNASTMQFVRWITDIDKQP